MPKPILYESEKQLEALMNDSNGMLIPDSINMPGRFFCGLVHKDHPRIMINHRYSKRRCLQVQYWVCGDRKINGQWKGTEYIKTRSFKHHDSLLKFVKSIV